MINLSKPGTINSRILAILADAFDRGMSNCKAVIVECRLGVGGSAANASHAVNDFRKLCNIDAYTPVDNVSEITAKTNDEGFETIYKTDTFRNGGYTKDKIGAH